jgi:hypothetical protein
MVICSLLFWVPIHFGGLRVFSSNKKKRAGEEIDPSPAWCCWQFYQHAIRIFFTKAMDENQKVIADLWLFAYEKKNNSTKKMNHHTRTICSYQNIIFKRKMTST